MKYTWLILVAAVLISGWFLIKDKSALQNNNNIGTSEYEYGEAVLEMGKAAEFPHVSITPLTVTDDSRCPEGVQCIWAGTVKVNVKVVEESGNFTSVIELGQTITSLTSEIALVSVEPVPKVGETIEAGEYRFTFNVVEGKAATENPGTGGCFVGGCSSQLCTDDSGVASTCEYRADYACYRTAKCARQLNGQCGWTETPELKQCLMNPPAL